MNILAGLEFELNYSEAAVQPLRHDDFSLYVFSVIYKWWPLSWVFQFWEQDIVTLIQIRDVRRHNILFNQNNEANFLVYKFMRTFHFPVDNPD